jgi:predicted solute-binding protein
MMENLKDVAARIVHHTHGTMKLNNEDIEKYWRYKYNYKFENLENLGLNVVRPWIGKFESEVAKIRSILPQVIEPKSFLARLFSDWT